MLAHQSSSVRVCVCVFVWCHTVECMEHWDKGSEKLERVCYVQTQQWLPTPDVGLLENRGLESCRWRCKGDDVCLMEKKTTTHTHREWAQRERKEEEKKYQTNKKINDGTWLPQWVKTRALAQWIEAGEKSSCEWVDDVQANEGSTIKTNIIG